MNFIATIKNFAKDESGAVTVDWVVLTAAIVGLGLGVIALVSNGVDNIGERIETALCAVDVDGAAGGACPE